MRIGSMGYLIVFLGGGIGAALRHGVNLAFARLLGTAFPCATLFENVAALFAFKGGIPQHWQLFLTTGFLGGFMNAANSGSRLFMWRCQSRCRSEACSRGSPLCVTSSSPSPACRVCRVAPCRGR